MSDDNSEIQYHRAALTPSEAWTVNEMLSKLTRKDIREFGSRMTDTEARLLVDYYYISQADRLRFNNQVRQMADEPNMMLSSMAAMSTLIENVVQKALDDYTAAHPVAGWMRRVFGIGPVISAGFLAHIDITKAPTAGHIWSYCGINPEQKWEKGQKRPWNATLKTLCFKAGESFVKTCNSEKSYYGKLYRDRKELETAKNLAGEYKEQAAKELLRLKDKTTVTYAANSAGRLSDGHIHARARRWAVKIFLSHLHQVMYEAHFGEKPPKPFAIAVLGHAHIFTPEAAIANSGK